MRMRRWGLIAVLATILALLMVGPVFAGGRQGDPPGLDRAIAAQEAHTNALLARPGVVGTAVGLGADGQAVVIIYAASAGVPGLPHQLDGVPVKVRVTGRFFALCHKGGNDPNGCDQAPPGESVDPTARFDRPVPIGISTGHPDITAGTIGARVTDGTNVYALSNNHVYANQNDASMGDNVLQPGAVDGGVDPDDAIGTLYAYEQLLYDGSDNTMDAAIALTDVDTVGNATPSNGYGTPNATPVSATLNQAVQKYGRTTSLTTGTVSEINVTVNVCYEGFPFCTKLAKFVDQIAISDGSFSAGGDSGSLIVTNDATANPVGLLFAGSSTRTIANRIDLVLTQFGVTIDGEAGNNSPPPLAITTTSLPVGTVDQGYSATLEATGGSTSYTWDIVAGALPTVLTLNTSTGEITGTPNGAGTFDFTVEVTDSADPAATHAQELSIAINPGGGTFSLTVSYATEGGKNGDKHLLVTFAANGGGGAVSGVTFSHTLSNTTDGSWGPVTGTTGGDGTVTFTLKNFPDGCYSVTVHSADEGWDNTVTDPPLCKPAA